VLLASAGGEVHSMPAASSVAVTGTSYPAANSPQFTAPSTDDMVTLLVLSGDVTQVVISFDGTTDHLILGTAAGVNKASVQCGPGAKIYAKRVGGATAALVANFGSRP
jgi:hypothetical protein